MLEGDIDIDIEPTSRASRPRRRSFDFRRISCASTFELRAPVWRDSKHHHHRHRAASIMSWRNNAGSTGSNNIPLGTRRRGGDSMGPSDSPVPNEGKRGRSPEPVPKEPELNPDGTKKRRKRNRWGDASDNKAAGLMNLPTAITAPMTAEQLDAYVTHLRIEEISQKLRINDVVPADGDR